MSFHDSLLSGRIPGDFGEFGGRRTPSLHDLVRIFGGINSIPTDLLPPEFRDNSNNRDSNRNGGGNVGTGVNSGSVGFPGLQDTEGGIPPWVQDAINIITTGINSGRGNGNNAFDSEGQELIPDWLLPILSAVAGGLENRSGTSRTEGNIEIDPSVSAARDSVFSGFQGILDTDPDLSGFLANSMQNRNKGAQIEERNLSERLAQRGIFGPAREVSLAGVDSRRIAGNVQDQNSLPLLARQLREGTLTGFGTAVADAPFGSTSTETTNTEGNVLGGGLTSLTAMLARLRGLNS